MRSVGGAAAGSSGHGWLRVAAAHFLGDLAPRSGPEGGQVAGGLDRAVRRAGDGEVSGTRPPATVGCALRPYKRLGADFDRRAAGRGIVDRVGGAGGRVEMGRGEPVDRARRVIAEQAVERAAKRAGIDRVEAALAGQQRAASHSSRRCEQGMRRRASGIAGSCAAAKAARRRSAMRAFGPRQEREAVAAHGVEQRGLDRRLVGLGVGRGGQADRAEPAALGRADRGGGGVEADLACSARSRSPNRASTSA